MAERTEITTLEQAQKEILRLDNELKTRDAERETLLQDNETLKTSLEEARTLNQQLFLEVRQGTVEPEPEPTEPTLPTCEEIAKKLHF